MLRGDAKSLQGYGLLSACNHLVSSVESLVQIVMFQKCVFFVKDVTKCVCVMMIDICKHSGEIHIAGFLDDCLCTRVYLCMYSFMGL